MLKNVRKIIALLLSVSPSAMVCSLCYMISFECTYIIFNESFWQWEIVELFIMHCGDKLWPFLSIMLGSKVATLRGYFCLWFSFIFKLIQEEKVVRATNMKSMRDWCGINAGRFRLCSRGVEQLNSLKPAGARQARNVTFWNVLQVPADIQCFI